MLTLYFHPLSSFCHKVLIALYENGTPFTPKLVNLQDEAERAAFHALWPVGKFPMLQDSSRDLIVPESSIIIEYLDQHYPGATKFIPHDPEQARAVRSADRFYDLHIHLHMQKMVGDRLRPPNAKDPHGVQDARTRMKVALGIVEQDMAGRTWAAGGTFTMADCAAAPALFYADKVTALSGEYPNLVAYLDRLKQRAPYARTLQEAEPYFKFFPRDDAA
jgi:glutathione S-transferase